MAESPLETPEILSRSPEEGARRLALAYLDQAAAALPRIAGDEDPEALHDLRVALRRLRSGLKSYAGQLEGSVPKKLTRRLRRLADATGPGRDAEVMIAWLRRQSGELGPHQRGHRYGLAWLLARLEERKEEAYRDLRTELADDFSPLAEGLRRRLSVYRAELTLDGGEVDQRLLRAARRRTLEPGLLALARLNRARRDRLFAAFAERWQGEGAEELLGAAEALAEALRAAVHDGAE